MFPKFLNTYRRLYYRLNNYIRRTVLNIIKIIGILTFTLALLAGDFLFQRHQTASKSTGSSNPATPLTASPHPTSATDQVIRLLPLGDSYTIGLGVKETDRWPNQLIDKLNQQGKSADLLANPAVSGYTTTDLIKHELPVLKKHRPNLVTLLIGTNDLALLGDLRLYESDYRHIVAEVLAQLPPDARLLLFTLPNYIAAPAGAALPLTLRASRANLIKAYNQVIRQVAEENRLTVIDTYRLATDIGAEADMYIADGFHPSALQYSLWANEVLNVISTL